MVLSNWVNHHTLRSLAGVTAALFAFTLASLPSGAANAVSSTYPNKNCTIPDNDYYDFYDDCAAYTNWGKYIPDGAISSGPWFVDLPTALGDTVSALSYNGKTYIQGIAHGTEMSFNFHEGTGDCDNPTEPGAWNDDLNNRWGVDWSQYPWLGPSTTEILNPPSYPSAASVTTKTRLAEWLANGQKDSYCPNGAKYPNASPYTSQLSPYVLSKTVTVGPLAELSSLPNVMRIDGDLTVESTPGATPVDSVFITFLRCNFTSWYRLPAGKTEWDSGLGPGNSATDAHLASAQESTSGQNVDVLVAATSDGSQAFALYSPKALNTADPTNEQEYQYLQDSPAGCGYGKQLSDQITFPSASSAKRNAGNYRYRVYVAVGTLEQVKSAVLAMRNDSAL
ncbi:MAG: hypothetical protein J2P17_31550 [Mycobacterium sp.]|nr:hypothetical protein [Mycobacterium sp.]